MKLLKWYEIVGVQGFYWKFSENDRPTIVEVGGMGDTDSISYIGLESESLLDEEQYGDCTFVKIEEPDISKQLEIDVYAQQRQFQHANGDSAFPVQVEGYWRQSNEPNEEQRHTNARRKELGIYEDPLPWPVVWEIPEFDKQEFINKLADVEDDKAEKILYRGFGICRLTGKNRGNAEYSYNGWKWPAGFIEYVRMGVPPSRAFYAFIMKTEEENCKYLPTYNR